MLAEIFIPKDSFVLAAKKIQNDLGLRNFFWGLHLRGTDARKSELYYSMFYWLSYLLPGKIFLATDDRDLLDYFFNNSRIISRQYESNIQKADPASGWEAKVIDENQEIHRYNVHRGRSQVEDAVIDLLILSKSNLLTTSSSTFLELAANISKKTLLITRQLFYIRFVIRIYFRMIKRYYM